MKKVSMFLLGLVLSVLSFAAVLDNGFNAAFGPLFHPAPHVPPPVGPRQGLDSLHRWNVIAIDATGLDHTPVAPGENRTFGEQLGPGRASRAMAIVHIAIFDAINAIAGQYRSFTGIDSSPHLFSSAAAVAQAAHDTLVSLYPSQKSTFDQALTEDLLRIGNTQQKDSGVALGKKIGAAILASRVGDGSEKPELHLGVDYSTSNLPGHWRQDPISQLPIALGAHWGACKPFVIKSGTQFQAPAPPTLTSAAYTTAFNEAKRSEEHTSELQSP